MNIQIQRLTFLLRIQVVSGSNLGTNTVYPQVFRVFLSLYRKVPGQFPKLRHNSSFRSSSSSLSSKHSTSQTILLKSVSKQRNNCLAACLSSKATTSNPSNVFPHDISLCNPRTSSYTFRVSTFPEVIHKRDTCIYCSNHMKTMRQTANIMSHLGQNASLYMIHYLQYLRDPIITNKPLATESAVRMTTAPTVVRMPASNSRINKS